MIRPLTFLLSLGFVSSLGFGSAIVVSRAALLTALATSLTGLSPIGPMSGVGVDSDGLFNLCPQRTFGSICVSSQDDRPACFQSPWTYDGDYSQTKRKLISFIEKKYGDKAAVQNDEDPRYLRVLFAVEGSSELEDYFEFYFTPNDSTVQFRGERKWIDSSRTDEVLTDFGANAGKAEKLRIGLGLESVPVLRNRKRVLLFFESPFDRFGPSTSDLNQVV